MLFVFAIDLFNEFLDTSLYGLQALEFMFLTFTTDLLYGPLIWLYARHVTTSQNEISGFRLALHFVPFGIHTAVSWSKIPMVNDPELLMKYPELLDGNQI